MCSSLDRYYQIVKCFRDEDFRANRQPEFTQIDIELSFTKERQVQLLVEGLMIKIWKECAGVDLSDREFPRMSYDQAMSRYGVDAPDARFGMEIEDISEIAASSEFAVFQAAVAEGGKVKGICLDGGATLSRSQLDELTEFARSSGAKGLAWIKYVDGEFNSPIAKFFKEGEKQQLIEMFAAESGSLMLFVADAASTVEKVLGLLRIRLGEQFGKASEELAFLWVEKFPLVEYDTTLGRYVSVHHPFTSPLLETEEDCRLLAEDPTRLHARAYDLVLNGQEVGGGSIRIHDAEIQQKMFEVLGIGEDEARRKFGFLLDALTYGAPPHGGIALGLDRLTMILGKKQSIRDVIAFPQIE